MKRGEIIYWEILDPLTLEPIIKAGTRWELRELCQGDGLLASVRFEEAA